MIRRRVIVPALLAVALALTAAGDRRARGAGAQSAAAAFPGTAAEVEAYELLVNDKLLSARTHADKILANDPDSAVGHFVLGSVLRDAEGSLPRSLAQLREAQRLFEANLRYADVGGSQSSRRLHRDILTGIADTAGLMEKYDDVLQVLDYHDSLFEPALVGQHAWPLMKLKRYDEARWYARRAIATDRTWQVTVGLNALCAIESEAHNRQAAYDACVASLEQAKKRVAESGQTDPDRLPHVAVHAHNAALSALALSHHDEAERFALDGTKRLESSVSNPWRTLVQLYLAEGRGGEAVSALRNMGDWCAHQPPGTRDQKEAETDATTAMLLLAAGEATAGLRFISRGLERPDRQGLSSAAPEQAIGGHAVIRRALRRVQAELAAEEASTRGVAQRVGGVVVSFAARAAARPDEERVINVLSDDETLEATLRPYLDGGLDDLPTWLTGDVIDVVGPGVATVALQRARAAESMPVLEPFFDELEAAIALARGDLPRALSLAKSALDKLPPAEALLRARAAAEGAEAALRAGDVAAAFGLFARSLELDPGTVRRLGFAIPATMRVHAQGGDVDEALEHAAAALRRSPRFVRVEAAEGAFEVTLTRARGPRGAVLQACLLGPFQASFGCAEAEQASGESAGDWGARLARELHRTVFSMKLPVTDTDVRSLDGTTTMARDTGRERLRGILEGVGHAPR